MLPLRLEPDVGIVRQHLRRHVPRNRHDGRIARLRFGKLGDGVVPQIVESKRGKAGSSPQTAPCCTPSRLRARMGGFARGEDIMLRLNLSKALGATV